MKKKYRVSDLFYNNRFLLIFSVLVAVVFWLVVVVELGVEVENTVRNVPVQIDYATVEENLGLKPFGEKAFTVDVTVKGKKYIVESSDMVDDLVVKANTSYVNSAGNSTLKLEISSKNTNPAYDVIRYSADEVSVYFDYPGEKEFVVTPELEFDGEPVAEGYHIGEYIFPESDTVRVSGPETEVNKISGIVARANVKGGLKQNETVEAELVALTESDETLRNITFSRKSGSVRITLPVYKVVNLPLTCGFSNKPSDYVDSYPFTVSISPASADIGVPEQKLDGIAGFEIKSVDFSEIKEGVNTFTVKPSDITGGVVVSDVEEFRIIVNVHGMTSGKIGVPANISFVNEPSDSDAELIKMDFSEMTVIGPSESVELMNADNVTVTADLSGIPADLKGNVTVPVMIKDDDCWSYGEYTATVSIS